MPQHASTFLISTLPNALLASDVGGALQRAARELPPPALACSASSERCSIHEVRRIDGVNPLMNWTEWRRPYLLRLFAGSWTTTTPRSRGTHLD